MENWSTSWSVKELGKDSSPISPKAIVKFLSDPLLVSFYQRNTVEVARDLLGKLLIVSSNTQTTDWMKGPRLEKDLVTGLTAGRIVETEAYRGDDPASHSCRGLTPRNSVMFGESGVAYVYFIYGMYEMLNFVTEKAGFPGAVLIRAVQPVFGEELMKSRRRSNSSREELTNGPGKLCRSMGIQMSHNGMSLRGPSLFVCDDGFSPPEVRKSGRVGIRLGTEKLWRFFIPGNPFVSRARQNRESQSA